MSSIFTTMFQLSTEIIEIAILNQHFKIHQITNIDELMDELIKKDNNHIDVKDERIPYWAELWPSSIAMSQFLLENYLDRDLNQHWLEIGCGLGLPSIVAGKLGVDQMTVTDYLQESVDWAATNWKENITEKAFLGKTLDWRDRTETIQVDVMLASDVAYEKRAFADLEAVFLDWIKPQGKLILSEPSRKMTEPFLQNLCNKYPHTVRHYPMVWRGVTVKVGVYEFTRP